MFNVDLINHDKIQNSTSAMYQLDYCCRAGIVKKYLRTNRRIVKC